MLLPVSGSFGCKICNYRTTRKHSHGFPCQSKDGESRYSDWLLPQWLYILLHSMQVSSSFVVVCGRTLQKALSKSVKTGGLEDEGWPCMAPEGEEAEESACWQSCSSSHTEKPSVRCSTALSSLSLKLQPWGGSACSSTCLRKPTSGRPT